MLQAISKYLRCESQILKEMLKQEHDQIDDVEDVINHNVSDAKDEIIAELENTKKEVLDCIKIELKEHMNQLFESWVAATLKPLAFKYGWRLYLECSYGICDNHGKKPDEFRCFSDGVKRGRLRGGHG